MTDESAVVPLLVGFGERLPAQPEVPYRYSHERQVGEVFVNGAWRTTSAVRERPRPGTRRTLVPAETTDDE